MAQVENATSLTDLERVKEHGKITSEAYDAEITKLIKETTARIQRYCGRHFLSRIWTHNGLQAHQPRLDSHGGTELFLPEMPITNVATLKVYPTAAELTEGYDEDFIVHALSGIIELVNGNGFYVGSQLVEITYTAGYLTGQTTQASWVFGDDEASADIRLAATMQTAWQFHQKQKLRDGIASMSSEGVSVQYLNTAWLPEVEDILERHRVRMPSWT